MKIRRIITLIQESEHPVSPDEYEGATTAAEIADKDREYCLDDPSYFLEGEFTDYSVIVRCDD